VKKICPNWPKPLVQKPFHCEIVAPRNRSWLRITPAATRQTPRAEAAVAARRFAQVIMSSAQNDTPRL
jgi:hypothetical protein